MSDRYHDEVRSYAAGLMWLVVGGCGLALDLEPRRDAGSATLDAATEPDDAARDAPIDRARVDTGPPDALPSDARMETDADGAVALDATADVELDGNGMTDAPNDEEPVLDAAPEDGPFDAACACVDDGDPCTVESCSAGTCMRTIVDGLACNDGDPCTRDDKCTSMGCVGTLEPCELRHSDCVTYACGDPFACEPTPANEGMACRGLYTMWCGYTCNEGACLEIWCE